MCIICAQRTPDNFLARLDLHASARLGASAGIPDGIVLQGLGAVSERTDAPDTTATPLTLLVGQSAYGTISEAEDVDWYALQVVAGQTYEVRLLGVGYQYLEDPLLGLYDSTGTYLASNDDGFSSFSDTHESDSRLTFTATSTGTYYLEADNYYGFETGSYLLSVTQSDPDGMVFTVDEIAWQLTNNGNAYFGRPEAGVFDVGEDGSLTVDVTGLTAEGQYLAGQALLAWTIVTGITFTYVTSDAEITFDDTYYGAYADAITTDTQIVSATVNIGTDWLEEFGTSLDSYSFETYIHEIGHALGLGHGGNYNFTATYGVDNYYLNDSLAWSIMSYMQAYNDEFDYGETGDVNSYLDASFRHIFTPQIADIIAIHYLYGGITSSFVGNTTYGYNGNTGVTAIDNAVASGALMAMTVYDDGGTDTLDFSGYKGDQEISLIEESLSSVMGGASNLGIARFVVIENALGGSGNDVLLGNDAANTLNGGRGADTMMGGAGDDIYIADGTDVITEVADGGNDTVQSAFTHTLGTNLENLTLTGTAATNGTGNSQNNALTGNGMANTLNGGTGADTLMGGGGNDVYVTDGGDIITEAENSGTDTVRSSAAYTLGANLENLTLTGSAAINGTGNSLNNSLTGNGGANILNGGMGTDTLTGGAGNDIYVTDGNDTITEAVGAGTDTVQSSITFILADNLENLTLTGTAGISGTGNGLNNVLTGNIADNSLTGDAGNDTMNGGAGIDTLIGGAGNDNYITDGSDILIEAENSGTDTVQSSVTYVLGANFENLTLTGSAAINGTGNSLNNSLTGNGGANILNGGVGTDTLTGGAGNDIYVTDGNDTITEAVGAGTDTVQSSITFVLGDNLENLTLTGTAGISGTGNGLNNILTGNDAANTLNGGIGTDTLKGGAGNDIYVTDGADTITEGADAGTDTVQSSATYTLGAHLENLTLTGSAAIDGTGNSLNNSLIGNGMANILNGGLGMDRLTGGAGNDSFLFSSVTESGISATSSEVITDFVRGQDKINLSAIDAFTGSVFNDSFVWRGTSAFSDAANGEVRFQKVDNAGLTNDYTMVWIDNDADAGVEMAIRLTGLYDLAQTDFIL